MGNLQDKENNFNYSLSPNQKENNIINPNNRDKFIPDDFKAKMINEFILPYYKTNIEYVIKTKTDWSRTSVIFITISTALVGISSILSFASVSYPNKNLNFCAGSVSLIALLFKEIGSYANNVDHIKTLTMNDLLKNINIDHQMIDVSVNTEKLTTKYKDSINQNQNLNPNLNSNQNLNQNLNSNQNLNPNPNPNQVINMDESINKINTQTIDNTIQYPTTKPNINNNINSNMGIKI